MKEELSIEQAFDELNTIMEHMEEDSVSLEKSFELYKRGMELVSMCNNKLDMVEKKIIVLEGNEVLPDEL
ncbi:MAG: exodeoxyribonuclease VII small subunit [Lachnospiraceae bacterium]|nr:exodeoxyribonuclease VII small subunit [Lachnospiraceae bacterium]